jgi:hypothetical protein
MGLLDEYAVDMKDDIEVPSYEIDPGIYEFEIGDASVIEGTKKDPDAINFVIEYLIGDEGKKKSEWFRLPDDASNVTEDEKKKLGWLKLRLLGLGVPDDMLNSVEPDDLIGLTGTLEIRNDKTGQYQNIFNVKVQEAAPAAPVVKKARTPRAPAATAQPAAAEGESDEQAEPAAEPVAAPRTPRAKPATAVDNPFA